MTFSTHEPHPRTPTPARSRLGTRRQRKGAWLLAVFVLFLALRGRQAPVLPADVDHARFIDSETCMVCHDLEGDTMQEKNHPLRRDCMDCHGTQ